MFVKHFVIDYCFEKCYIKKYLLYYCLLKIKNESVTLQYMVHSISHIEHNIYYYTIVYIKVT